MSDIFDRRINRLREILSDREAALITNEKNIGYFCGFFHSEGYYLLTREKAYLLVDFRYIEAANQKAHGCEVICFHKLSEDLLKILAENEIKSVKIEAEYMTVARLRFFRHKLEAKGITVSDGSELDKKIAGCRIIKDETELEKIRTAQKIAEKAYLEMLNFVKVGVSERELAARLEFLMIFGSLSKR